jgi:DNA-binding transcriptional MerR regulator
MRYLKTGEAATMLRVSPNTLRSWEHRFGFPTPQRSPGTHRLYLHAELAGLQLALREGLSISGAVARARHELADHGNTLVSALLSYRSERADAAIETALSLRSLESAVEEILLPALEEIGRQYTLESAAWAFAARWGADWLRRARRFAPAPDRSVRIVVGDASRDELDPDFAHIRAFELLCGRAGVDVMSLSARGATGIGAALAVQCPDLVVLAGGDLADGDVARWVDQVRRAAGGIPLAVYRRGEQRMRMPTTGTMTLPAGASVAQRRLVELVETAPAARTIPATWTGERSQARQRAVAV